MGSWVRPTPNSEAVAAVGFDSEADELIVRWRESGQTTAYVGAPESVAIGLANAGSVGGMMNEDIKPKYLHHAYTGSLLQKLIQAAIDAAF